MEDHKRFCVYCAKEIPRRARICPYCQRDLRSWFRKNKIATFALLSFLLISVVNYLNWDTEKSEEYVTIVNPIVEGHTLPEYSIIEEVKLMNWWKYIWVLISTYSKVTPYSELEKTAKEISAKKWATKIGVYCSVEASKSDFSESYKKSHPWELEKCGLWAFNF